MVVIEEIIQHHTFVSRLWYLMIRGDLNRALCKIDYGRHIGDLILLIESNEVLSSHDKTSFSCFSRAPP